MAKIQVIPAILALNLIAITGLIILTLLFGRIYCSVICPLGIFQDGISYLAGKRKGKKNRFSYSPAKSWLRYGFLGLFILSIIAGISAVTTLLDPYASYGRITSIFLNPVYRWGNNILAWFAERADSYTFYSTEIWMKGGLITVITTLTLITIVFLAWKNGRTYCNTVCPVGTLLGIISRISVFKPVFDTEKCNGCGLCSRNCKSSCIDIKSKKIDYSRCVSCFNCIEKCNKGALKYSYIKSDKKKEIIQKEVSEEAAAVVSSNEEAGISRRSILSLLGVIAFRSTIKPQQLHVDGGLAEIEDKKIPDRKTPILPPGAISARNMKDHCTACQLCVSACPNNILNPSGKLLTFMQPEISYERGYCRPECTECSRVCPAGAIKPITKADKSAISIGMAVWIKDNCIVNTDNVQCNNCERHCPTGAITLIDRDPEYSDSLKIPVVDKELCIGCGACENLCPARPFSAIYVEGNIRHHSI